MCVDINIQALIYMENKMKKIMLLIISFQLGLINTSVASIDPNASKRLMNTPVTSDASPEEISDLMLRSLIAEFNFNEDEFYRNKFIVENFEIGEVFLLNAEGKIDCKVPEKNRRETSPSFMKVSTQVENLSLDIPFCNQNQIVQISDISQSATLGAYGDGTKVAVLGPIGATLSRAVIPFVSSFVMCVGLVGNAQGRNMINARDNLPLEEIKFGTGFEWGTAFGGITALFSLAGSTSAGKAALNFARGLSGLGLGLLACGGIAKMIEEDETE